MRKKAERPHGNLWNYLISTTIDAPEIESILVEANEPRGPFGVKGLGEAVNIATAPVILNAIHNATGIRVRDLPAMPEKILCALREGA